VIRRARRRRERGAAVFIVVMVVALLTAIGVFTIRATSLADQAAGYDRQANQTAYLTEYAGRAVTAEIGDGAGKVYLDKVANGSDQCLANKNLDPNALDATLAQPLPCYKLFISEISDRVNAHYSGQSLIDTQSASASGSLGPKADPAIVGATSVQEGVFVVEMTDPAESVPTPGSSLGGNNPSNVFRDVQLTFTALGQIRPLDTAAAGANPWCAAGDLSASASVSSLRAHVTLKNVPR
jgi:hypothetical protein